MIVKNKNISSFLLAKMYEINFHHQLLVRVSCRNILLALEKVLQIIRIVLETERSIKSITFIFLGFCLNFKSTFGMTLREHLKMATSAIIFYIAIDDKNKTNMKVAVINISIKIHQLFSKQRIIGVRVIIVQWKISGGLDTNLLVDNVQTILVKITIKLILIFLSNSFFNFFMKMKKEKWTVFRFPFFYEKEKRMRVLKFKVKIYQT